MRVANPLIARSGWSRALLLCLAGLLLFARVYTARAASELPRLEGHVTDGAAVLSARARGDLEQKLRQYAVSTGHQFAFVSVSSLDGAPIEDYSIRLAEKWKLGDQKRDDGLILLVAPSERQMRIEVGYGLEGVITDALSARVIRNELTPAFRRGDFDGGVSSAFELLMRAASGEAVGAPVEPAARVGSRILPWVLMMLIFGLMLSGRGGGPRGRGGLFLGGLGSLGGRGGFGGGGFSGGGGGFGGGGSSGRW